MPETVKQSEVTNDSDSSGLVTSGQKGVHPRLENTLRRHLESPWLQPFHQPTLVVFSQLVAQGVLKSDWPLILDSGCGTGKSTRQLAGSFPGHIVVGVGNIYASEALFMAGIHPNRAAGRVSRQRYEGLVEAIRDVLDRAIKQGGTTLRDFSDPDGTPGYFAQELLVYDRAGKDCFQCGTPVRQKVIGQRSSYYCPACQR